MSTEKRKLIESEHASVSLLKNLMNIFEWKEKRLKVEMIIEWEDLSDVKKGKNKCHNKRRRGY